MDSAERDEFLAASMRFNCGPDTGWVQFKAQGSG